MQPLVIPPRFVGHNRAFHFSAGNIPLEVCRRSLKILLPQGNGGSLFAIINGDVFDGNEAVICDGCQFKTHGCQQWCRVNWRVWFQW